MLWYQLPVYQSPVLRTSTARCARLLLNWCSSVYVQQVGEHEVKTGVLRQAQEFLHFSTAALMIVIQSYRCNSPDLTPPFGLAGMHGAQKDGGNVTTTIGAENNTFQITSESIASITFIMSKLAMHSKVER
jgi:hypothetical protein